jgi:hypothetical protein
MNQETQNHQAETSRQIFELPLEEALLVAGGPEIENERRPK